MSGLDLILDSIIKSGNEKAEAEINGATNRANELIEVAKSRAALESEEREALAKKSAEKIVSAAESTAESEKKRALLAAKSKLIDEVINKAKDELDNLGTSEYFAVITDMIVKNSSPYGGTVLFGKRDLDRLPKDFCDNLNKKLPNGIKVEVSDTPTEIKDGFILNHGDIEENCSFDAIIEDKCDRLRDAVAAILFG